MLKKKPTMKHSVRRLRRLSGEASWAAELFGNGGADIYPSLQNCNGYSQTDVGACPWADPPGAGDGGGPCGWSIGDSQTEKVQKFIKNIYYIATKILKKYYSIMRIRNSLKQLS